jgi:gliding motility-associated-like protein
VIYTLNLLVLRFYRLIKKMKNTKLLACIVALLFSCLPGLEAQTNQSVPNCGSTAAEKFTDTGCTYKWVNNMPEIGLAAAGIGNIPSFKAVNSGSSPVVATITASPVATEYAYIANSQLNTVSVINILTDSLVATIQTGSTPWGVSVSPNGKFAYVTNDNPNGSVSVISTGPNTVAATIPVGSFPFGITVSPDGKYAYVTNNNYAGTVSVISTASNTLTATIPVGAFPFGIVVSPDGSRVYLTNNFTYGTVTVINTATDMVVDTIPVGSLPYSIAISPDGSTLYIANNVSNTVSVISTSSLTVTATIPVGQGPTCISLSPDGKTAYVANAVSETVSVINTATNMVITNIPVGSIPWGVSVSPDGNWIIVGNQGSNTVSVIDAGTNAIIQTLSGFSGPVSIGNFISQGPDCNAPPLTFTITVGPQLVPSVVITASADEICAGESVSFTATPTNGGTAPSYQWVVNDANSGSNNPAFSSNSLKNGDSVFCIMTSSLACALPDSSDVIQLIVNPSVDIQFNPDTIYTKNNAGIRLSPILSGPISGYQWSPASGLDSTNIADPLANPASNTIYQLLVTTDSGCTATAKILVVAGRPLKMPNAFTPNGDGHNDLFRIPPGVQFNLDRFNIFDRWGNLVFSTADITQGWNGIYKGVAAGIGTYVYVILGKTLTGQPVKLDGSFVLVR